MRIGLGASAMSSPHVGSQKPHPGPDERITIRRRRRYCHFDFCTRSGFCPYVQLPPEPIGTLPPAWEAPVAGPVAFPEYSWIDSVSIISNTQGKLFFPISYFCLDVPCVGVL